MGLNEGVLDDLEDTPIVDNDAVIQPSPIVQNKNEEITIVPETDEIKATGVVPPEEIAKLPEMDVKFKLVEDGAAKVIELKDVEAEIIGQESMSRHSAEYVNTAFEGFLSGPIRLAEFTAMPSKTNLGYTKTFMSRVIAKEEERVFSSFQLLIDGPANEGKTLLENLQGTYIPAVKERLSCLRGTSYGLAERLSQTKNAVFPYDGSFVDLRKIELKNLDVNKIDSDQVDKKALGAAIASIKMLLECPFVNALIWTAQEGKSYDNVKDPQTRMSYSGCPVTVMDLLKFYSSDVDGILDQVASEAEDAVNCLSELQEDKDKQDNQSMGAFINESLPCVMESFKSVNRLTHLVNDLSCLVVASSHLFQFYHKL